MTDMAQVCSARDAAAELGVSVRTVLRRIELGEISAAKLGTGRTSAYVIETAEIERIKREATSA